eukprot:CAMPEP_0116870760 /NCGR_PEP_ID=MMETSP0463-20121206/825_1 /TAXON_ID=181622 /ORGANISM="Strombidinopsis sp, Strain SopsisLIS2011" /LENGTH=36 /DNA_ID= /DNA_START= /DNA_END= /DNA_ORIENTATION=
MADLMRKEFETNLDKDRDARKNELAEFMKQKDDEIA